MINPADWYWFVAGDTAKAYSSASNTYVASDDAALVSKTKMGCPGAIASERELWEYYQRNAPSLMPNWLYDGTTFSQPAIGEYSKAQLAAYSASTRYNHASGGIIITALSPAMFLSDPQSRNTVNSAYDYAKAYPGGTLNWKMSDGTFIVLSDADLTTLMSDMATFVHACFICESNTLNAINAGTITTLAAIDSAYAAVLNIT